MQHVTLERRIYEVRTLLKDLFSRPDFQLEMCIYTPSSSNNKRYAHHILRHTLINRRRFLKSEFKNAVSFFWGVGQIRGTYKTTKGRKTCSSFNSTKFIVIKGGPVNDDYLRAANLFSNKNLKLNFLDMNIVVLACLSAYTD